MSPTDQVAKALLAHAMAAPPPVATVAVALLEHAMAGMSPLSQAVQLGRRGVRARTWRRCR